MEASVAYISLEALSIRNSPSTDAAELLKFICYNNLPASCQKLSSLKNIDLNPSGDAVMACFEKKSAKILKI